MTTTTLARDTTDCIPNQTHKWAATIVGLDPQYGLEREFIDRVKRTASDGKRRNFYPVPADSIVESCTWQGVRTLEFFDGRRFTRLPIDPKLAGQIAKRLAPNDALVWAMFGELGRPDRNPEDCTICGELVTAVSSDGLFACEDHYPLITEEHDPTANAPEADPF